MMDEQAKDDVRRLEQQRVKGKVMRNVPLHSLEATEG